MIAKKWTLSERKNLRGVISDFYITNPRITYSEIGEFLNKAGYEHINKGRWTNVEVGNFLANKFKRGMARKKTRNRVVKTPTFASPTPDTLKTISSILESNLTANVKVDLVRLLT